MAQLLTYNEFKIIVDFQGGTDSDKFNRIEQVKEETYLYGLIGEDLTRKLQDGDYSALMPLTKKVLAWEILRYYIEIGNVIVNTNGGIQRKSDFSESIEYSDKQNKIKETIKVLQQYESRLISLIETEEIEEWNENKKTTPVNTITITSIGD
ncbi:MAG TPA: hypothetical protein PLM49_03735 [Bacteroidales bacterium]|nr:hypothetical protein [Bacteroidales bacterium]